VSVVVDLGGIATAFRGSDQEHVAAIAATCGSLRPHDGAPELEITFGGGACRVPADPWDLADGDVRAWWRPDGLYLAHGAFTAHVRGTEAHIGGDGNRARGFRQLMPYVITQMLAPYGRFVLHGGAIHVDGHAVLVLGSTGSGKSTLVTAALCAGWHALGDDLVVVRPTATGPVVTGIAKPLTVPAEVAGAAPLPARPVAGDVRGRWELSADLADPSWYPVASTVVSRHGTSPAAELRPLAGRALSEWLLHSFLCRHDPTRLRAYLPVVAGTARRGGWELAHGESVECRVSSAGARLGELRADWDGQF
jgi:hypothetical protein